MDPQTLKWPFREFFFGVGFVGFIAMQQITAAFRFQGQTRHQFPPGVSSGNTWLELMPVGRCTDIPHPHKPSAGGRWTHALALLPQMAAPRNGRTP